MVARYIPYTAMVEKLGECYYTGKWKKIDYPGLGVVWAPVYKSITSGKKCVLPEFWRPNKPVMANRN